MLYYAKISGERLQDHWSSGFKYVSAAPRNRVNHYGISLGRCNMSYIYGHMCIWKTKRVPKLILLYSPFDLTALNDIKDFKCIRGLLFKFIYFHYYRSEVLDRVIKSTSSVERPRRC